MRLVQQPVLVWLVMYALVYLGYYVGLEMWKREKQTPLAILMLVAFSVITTAGLMVVRKRLMVMWKRLMATVGGDEGRRRLISWLWTWHHRVRTQLPRYSRAQQVVRSRGEYDGAV